MTLQVNEIKTIAQSQNFQFENLVIQKVQNSLSANLQFAVYNEKGVRIETRNYEYRDEAFNAFWASFNSGKFLYDELIQKSKLPIQVDVSIESDFVYVKPIEATNPVVEDNIIDEE